MILQARFKVIVHFILRTMKNRKRFLKQSKRFDQICIFEQ